MAKTGRQTPTHEYKISYRRTLGKDAVTAYEKTGRKAMSWQKKLLNVILAVNADKLWTHTKYGYSVPRRNGKNEVVVRQFYKQSCKAAGGVGNGTVQGNGCRAEHQGKAREHHC